MLEVLVEQPSASGIAAVESVLDFHPSHCPYPCSLAAAVVQVSARLAFGVEDAEKIADPYSPSGPAVLDSGSSSSAGLAEIALPAPAPALVAEPVPGSPFAVPADAVLSTVLIVPVSNRPGACMLPKNPNQILSHVHHQQTYLIRRLFHYISLESNGKFCHLMESRRLWLSGTSETDVAQTILADTVSPLFSKVRTSKMI